MNRANIAGAAALAILPILMSCSAGPIKVAAGQSITGRWEGVDHAGKPGSFHFLANGTVRLVIDGRSLGGSDPDVPFFLTYRIDYEKDPVVLEIIGTDTTGYEYGRILMAVSFEAQDRIKIYTDFTETLPAGQAGTRFELERSSE